MILRSVDVNEKLQKEANERQDTLIAELNHRVRNILTLIQGLVSQTMESADNTQKFAKQLDGRIKALARAHDQITQDQWSPAPLKTLFVNELNAYSPDFKKNVRLEGPHAIIDPQAFSSMALVVHEMVTNSAKYGALSAPKGILSVTWELDPQGNLDVLWREEGGPAVVPPSRRGFGSTIIQHSIPHELGGTAAIDYVKEGVQARFQIPERFVEVIALPPEPVRKFSRKGPQLSVETRDTKVLLVEDNMIIALDNEDMLRAAGFSDVVLAKDVENGLRAIRDHDFGFALLDINLGRENSIPIAEKLRELDIPFIFASGYDDASLLDEAFSDVPVVIKPFSKEKLVEVINLEMDED